jgi:hypothetical protein
MSEFKNEDDFVLTQEEVDKVCEDTLELSKSSQTGLKGSSATSIGCPFPRILKTKDYVRRAQKNWADKAKAMGKYRCDDCDINFRNNVSLAKHMNTLKHNPREIKEEEKKYHCDECSFISFYFGSFRKHLETDKHKKRMAALNQEYLVVDSQASDFGPILEI